MQMTRVEKIAENASFITISRVATIITPVIFSGLLFFAWAWIDDKFTVITTALINLNKRADMIDAVNANQSLGINEVQSKILSTDKSREERWGAVKDQFFAVNSTLKEVNTRLSDMNGSVIQLGTIINERLPKKDDHASIP